MGVITQKDLYVKQVTSIQESNRQYKQVLKRGNVKQNIEDADESVSNFTETAVDFTDMIQQSPTIVEESPIHNALNTKILQKSLRYLNDGNYAEYLLSFIKSSVKKDKLLLILDKLIETDDVNIDFTLNNEIKALNVGKNIAVLYGALAYLLEELRKKKLKKDKLDDRLKELLHMLERQNSLHLASFFDLLENPLVHQNYQLATGIASLNSGDAKVETLKDTLTFIHESLEDNYDHLVSKCLRLRAHILERLTNKDMSFEDRVELKQYMLFTKNLIILNSIYTKICLLRTDVAQNKICQEKSISVSENHHIAIYALLLFGESTTVNDHTINKFLTGLGVDKAHLGFLNLVLRWLASMPIELFNNLSSQKNKLLAGIRKSIIGNDQTNKVKIFDFIKNSKTRTDGYI